MQQPEINAISIFERRRLNLRALVSKYGSLSALGLKLKKQPSQMSHLLGPNPIRNIGETLARRFEQQLGLSPFWLDQERDPKTILSNARLIDSDKYVWFPTLDADQTAYMGSIALNESQLIPLDAALAESLKAQKEHCCFLIATDGGMTPIVNPEDRVLIDYSKTAIKNGHAYAVRFDKEIVIRRLFNEHSQAIKITCDNVGEKHRFPDIVLQASELADRLLVLGEVLLKLGHIR